MKNYSKMTLEELEAERQSLSNQMDSAITKYKQAIHEITDIINAKLAEEKIAGLSETEKKALAKAIAHK